MKELINLLKHVTGSNEDNFEKLYVSFTKDGANLNDVNILLKLYRESEEVFVKLAQECLQDLQKYTILLQVANLQKAVLGKIFSNEMSIIKIETSAEIDRLLSRFDFSEIKKELDLIYKSLDKAPPPKPGDLDQGESSSTQARTEENIKEEHPVVKNCRKAIGRLITIKPTGNPNVLTRINIQNIAILMRMFEKYTSSIFELSYLNEKNKYILLIRMVVRKIYPELFQDSPNNILIKHCLITILMESINYIDITFSDDDSIKSIIYGALNGTLVDLKLHETDSKPIIDPFVRKSSYDKKQIHLLLNLYVFLHFKNGKEFNKNLWKLNHGVGLSYSYISHLSQMFTAFLKTLRELMNYTSPCLYGFSGLVISLFLFGIVCSVGSILMISLHNVFYNQALDANANMQTSCKDNSGGRGVYWPGSLYANPIEVCYKYQDEKDSFIEWCCLSWSYCLEAIKPDLNQFEHACKNAINGQFLDVFGYLATGLSSFMGIIFLIYIAIYIYVYARHLNNRDLVFQEMHYIKPDIIAIVLQLNKLSQMLSDNSLERDVVIKAANFIKVYGSDSSVQEELRMVLKNILVEALTNLELNEVVIARDDGLNDATALLHKPTFTYGTVPM